jgi:hypothetical protein
MHGARISSAAMFLMFAETRSWEKRSRHAKKPIDRFYAD